MPMSQASVNISAGYYTSYLVPVSVPLPCSMNISFFLASKCHLGQRKEPKSLFIDAIRANYVFDTNYMYFFCSFLFNEGQLRGPTQTFTVPSRPCSRIESECFRSRSCGSRAALWPHQVHFYTGSYIHVCP